ncbi:hypothetical protein ACIGNX_13535 [Actinosynnema sp. NPDC053489]|uniref:hypothetical protein n=1 Tax=Actinosynnema sp. NPDC053489 TaxID=3363916 RepID=UPI0037C85217
MARIRPSKPAAVFGTVVGVALLVFGLLNFPLDRPFFWLWFAVGLGIVVFNLWAAFGKNGATEIVEDDRR